MTTKTKLVWVALFFASLATSALGQTTQSISGTIRDQSGGGIPGATVTVTQTTTGTVHAAMTNDQGAYAVLPFLWAPTVLR